jgi:nucleoid-associated protein YgaU
MDRGAKISIAAAIVLGGATLALLARRHAVEAAQAPIAPGEQLILRDRVAPWETGIAPQIGPQNVISPQAGAPSPKPAPPAEPPPAPAPAAAAPALAQTFPQPQLSTFGQRTPGIALAVTAHVTRTVRHRIADGDTLPGLAKRYLGSADRQAEIFAANRHVLTNPDLLPIGVTLLIPPRGPDPSPLSAGR